MPYAIPDLNDKVILSVDFAWWSLRYRKPSILRLNWVDDWVVATLFLGHDAHGNWPPRFWWAGACHPRYRNVACRFATEEGALRWHQCLIRQLLTGEAEITEFPRKS